MSAIEGIVVGDREVVARFARIVPAVRLVTVGILTRLALRIVRTVKADKLSGQVLRNRTGHLRQSVTHVVSDTPDVIEARVGIFQGPTVIYGRAHEYGFQGVVSVRAHVRTIREAFGRPIPPTVVAVGAHARTMHLPVRSWLRSTLDEYRPVITSELRAGVAGAAGGA